MIKIVINNRNRMSKDTTESFKKLKEGVLKHDRSLFPGVEVLVASIDQGYDEISESGRQPAPVQVFVYGHFTGFTQEFIASHIGRFLKECDQSHEADITFIEVDDGGFQKSNY